MGVRLPRRSDSLKRSGSKEDKMEYLNMKKETESVLIAFDNKTIEFWCDYDP